MADRENEIVAVAEVQGNGQPLTAEILGLHKAETDLGHRFEARLHAMGKELQQEYEATKAFVDRVFEGMPPHVRPGSVAPYNVKQPEERVILESEITEPSRGGPPDIMK